MKKAPLLNIITDAILTFCCAIAVTCAIPTAYNAPFELRLLILVEFPFALLVCAALHKFRKAWPPVLVFSAITALYGLIAREAIINGAKLVRYSALSLLSLDFSFLPTPEIPEGVLYPSDSVTAFLIFAAAVVTIITAVLLIKCKTPVPALLLPIPALIPAFIYTDSAPALYTVALLLIYWGGVLFRREGTKDKAKVPGLARAVFLLVLAGLALLIPLLSPQDRYDPIPFSERRGIMDLFGSLRDRMLSRNILIPYQYDLASEGDRTSEEQKAFSFCSSEPGVYALRTHSYGIYNGYVWRAAQDYTGAWNSMCALGATQSGAHTYIRIRDAYVSERLTPYAFLSRYDVEPGETFVRTNGKTAYVWVALSSRKFTPVVESAEENAYYNFAMEQYTLRNGPVKQRLLRLLEEQIGPEKLASLKEEDSYSAAKLVADFVRASGTYTLTPGKTPTGSDFVEYFLRDNRKGYCVHFASATTALLQALDVPARYVIGYRVEAKEAEKWIDVPRDASHAWTEVYVKGVGWLPIESTAGFEDAIGFYPDDHGASALPTATPEPLLTPEPVEYTIPPLKPHLATADPSARPSRSPSASAKPGGSGHGTVETPKAKPWGLLAIPAVVLVWLAIGAIIKRRRQRKFEQEDSKAAVLEMIGYLKSLWQYGAIAPDNIDELADEAAFSDHSMDNAQQELLRIVDENRNKIYRYKPIKRFILRRILFRI